MFSCKHSSTAVTNKVAVKVKFTLEGSNLDLGRGGCLTPHLGHFTPRNDLVPVV
jgi:hypothetical protein